MKIIIKFDDNEIFKIDSWFLIGIGIGLFLFILLDKFLI